MQIQKALFVLGQEYPDILGDFYEFSAHDYGPYSAELRSDLGELVDEGLIIRLTQRDGTLADWEIGQGGMDLVIKLLQTTDPRIAMFLAAITHWAVTVSRARLLHEIFQRYPKFRGRSTSD